MGFHRFETAEEFLAGAGEALYREEARNCLMIGVVGRLLQNPQFYGEGKPYLGLISDEYGPILAGSMTPPFGLLVSPFRENAGNYFDLLVQDLVESDWPLPDVHAVTPFAEMFAEEWAAQTGGRYEKEMAMRIYKLIEVVTPEDVAGEMVQATMADLELVADWLVEFEREALGEEDPSLEKKRKAAERGIERGDWVLWQVKGESVSMCLRTRPTRTGISVSGVYTPPELRGRGYASACVAALSQRLLDEGNAFTSLFTDLANPTSNSIYMKIGYRPLADFDKYKLVIGY